MELGKIEEIEDINVYVMEGPDATVWFYQGLKYAGNLTLNWIRNKFEKKNGKKIVR